MTSGCFIGLTTIDNIYYINNLPKENEKIKTNEYIQHIGGPAANAAITFSLLGGDTTLITYLGDSTIAKSVKSELKSLYNIKVYDLCNEKELPSIATILINKENGNRTVFSGQQIFKKIKHSELKKILVNADFYFSDCNIAENSLQYLKLIKSREKDIVLDLGSWKPYIDDFILLANDIIASNDCKPPSEENFFDYTKNHKEKNIAVTNGANKIYWKTSLHHGYILPENVKAIDTLGAGDIFHGSYCYYKFVKKMSFQDSLSNASKIATLSVKYNGTREWSKYI